MDAQADLALALPPRLCDDVGGVVLLLVLLTLRLLRLAVRRPVRLPSDAGGDTYLARSGSRRRLLLPPLPTLLGVAALGVVVPGSGSGRGDAAAGG